MFDFSEAGDKKGDRKETKRRDKYEDFESIAKDLNLRSEDEEDFGGFVRPKNKKPVDSGTEEKDQKKEEPCFEVSGILAEYSNSVKGVVLKFTEPLDAAVPGKDEQWKVYPFKGEQSLGKFNVS
jgi:smad nuclear-interacting protein 1